ncbi:lipoxygenase [Trifolium medium]|uniref:Lipoxygenase n=1 Tax=Trifolium medium TaxID=97028 RepID=A0A392LWZ7_9FABA|nr:lipoxygenase [Trifolium medium]
MSSLKGTVVLVHKNALNFNVVGDATNNEGDTVPPSFLDTSVAFKLISASKVDGTGKGKVGKKAFLEGLLNSIPTLGDKQSTFRIHFEWHNHDMGIPGAFYVENFMPHEFFLVSLSLEDVPNHGTINFVCNSWVYNTQKYKTDRIFFANKTYRPSETPTPLVYYIHEELKTLRGDGTGERHEWERIYDYDVYNDLGNPDLSATLARPVLGGSNTLPYPRRGRTGRKPTQKDPKSESHREDGYIYIPRDELLGPGKLSPKDVLLGPEKSAVRHELKSKSKSAVRDALIGYQDFTVEELFCSKESSDVLFNTLDLTCQYGATPQIKICSSFSSQVDENEFNSFKDVLNLYNMDPTKGFPPPKVIQGILVISHNYATH